MCVGLLESRPCNNTIGAFSSRIHHHSSPVICINVVLNFLSMLRCVMEVIIVVVKQMDKQSILGDAISYVLDLQKKVQDIEVEIQAMTRSNRPDHTQLVTAETTIKALTDANSALINSADMNQSPEKLISDGKILEVGTLNPTHSWI